MPVFSSFRFYFFSSIISYFSWFYFFSSYFSWFFTKFSSCFYLFSCISLSVECNFSLVIFYFLKDKFPFLSYCVSSPNFSSFSNHYWNILICRNRTCVSFVIIWIQYKPISIYFYSNRPVSIFSIFWACITI